MYEKLIKRANDLLTKRKSPEKALLALENIQQVIDDYSEENDEIKDLVAEETIDLETTLEIGVKPVGTCQHYVTGELNESLIGYTDPNTKIITVSSGDVIIARTIFRLLENDQGDPAFHIETIYSSTANPIISDLIYSLGIEKAKRMGGIPVYVSTKSQNAEGNNQEPEASADIILNRTNDRLRSRSIRAESVYVDSISGPAYGNYTMSNLLRLSQK